MSEPNSYEGFCQECECQTEVFHSSYLGMEICIDCKEKLLTKQHKNTIVKEVADENI
ncbi:hypothetical protein OGZ41_09970 [Lactococcus lactis]|nr:hypothetical protein [Lactococcus lactis]